MALHDQKNALDAAICARQGYEEIVGLLSKAKEYNRIDVWHNDGSIGRHASLKVRECMTNAADKNVEASRKARIAQFYSPDAPPIRPVNIERSRLIGQLDIVFDSAPVDLMVRKKVMAAYEETVNAYKDCEKTVKFLEEYSGRIQKHLDDCVSNIERWDRVILRERADVFHRNHTAGIVAQ